MNIKKEKLGIRVMEKLSTGRSEYVTVVSGSVQRNKQLVSSGV